MQKVMIYLRRCLSVCNPNCWLTWFSSFKEIELHGTLKLQQKPMELRHKRITKLWDVTRSPLEGEFFPNVCLFIHMNIHFETCDAGKLNVHVCSWSQLSLLGVSVNWFKKPDTVFPDHYFYQSIDIRWQSFGIPFHCTSFVFSSSTSVLNKNLSLPLFPHDAIAP